MAKPRIRAVVNSFTTRCNDLAVQIIESVSQPPLRGCFMDVLISLNLWCR